MKKIINKIEDYPQGLDVRAYKTAVANTRITCGLSYEMTEIICKIFAKELADALVHNGVLDVPHFGTFYYFNKTRDKQVLSFKMSQELKSIKNKGGIDENNFIRSIKKSTNGSSGGDENDI